MRRMLLVALLMLVSLGGAALAGHGPSPRDTQGGATAVPAQDAIKMRVELTQGRVDEVRHTVQVSMHNDGPAKLVVERVELQAPSFKGTETVTPNAWLPPGGLQVDVPLSYGTGVCSGDDLHPQAAPSFVALSVRTEDGRLQDVRLPVQNPNPMLDKLLGIDCLQAYLDRQATFTFGPWTHLPSGWVSGTVVVHRTGFKGTVTLQEFTGSILLEVVAVPRREATPKPYAVLKPGQDEVKIPIVVDGERCTPHALAEIKKPFVFPAWVSLDGGPLLYTELKITDKEIAAFQPVIDACAAGHTQM